MPIIYTDPRLDYKVATHPFNAPSCLFVEFYSGHRIKRYDESGSKKRAFVVKEDVRWNYLLTSLLLPLPRARNSKILDFLILYKDSCRIDSQRQVNIGAA
jgi:hypothetical protein